MVRYKSSLACGRLQEGAWSSDFAMINVEGTAWGKAECVNADQQSPGAPAPPDHGPEDATLMTITKGSPRDLTGDL